MNLKRVSRTQSLLQGLLAMLLLSLAACGFHLRGAADLSFQTLYLQQTGAPGVAKELKRLLKANGVKLVEKPEDAELQLELMSESRSKRILSLSGGGTVSEYELRSRVDFRARRVSSDPWGPPQSVEQQRDFSYDNTVLLAKDYEEVRLYNDMNNDAAREIVRRLSVLKPSSSVAP